MKIEESVVKNVLPDGKVLDGGAVITKGGVRMSTGEGCGIPGCHCSDGYWISIILPRNEKGEVRSVRVIFDSLDEMICFFTTHSLEN